MYWKLCCLHDSDCSIWASILHQSHHSIKVCLDQLEHQSIVPHVICWDGINKTLTTINNDINKELWAYLPNIIVHFLSEDFAAMICCSQKGFTWTIIQTPVITDHKIFMSEFILDKLEGFFLLHNIFMEIFWK